MEAKTGAIRRAGLELRPLQPFGTAIYGLDIAQPVAAEQLAAVKQAFLDSCLVVLKEQQAGPEPFVAFGRQFGVLDEHVLDQYLLPGYPQIFTVGNKRDASGQYVSAQGGAQHWHSDTMYLKQPSLGSLLYGRQCPPTGADTLYVDMYAGYRILPKELQQWLLQQTGISDYVYFYETFQPHRPALTPEQKAKAPPVEHPAVRTHPETRRPALFCNATMTSHFKGMELAESRKLLQEITATVTRSELQYRHRWEEGEIVFWDNRCTMHHATPFDEERYQRWMWRITVQGEIPFAYAAAA